LCLSSGKGFTKYHVFSHRHGVHGEVPSLQIFIEKASGMFPVYSVCRHFKRDILHEYSYCALFFSNIARFIKKRFNLVRPCISCNIHVMHVPLHVVAPDTASDKIRFKTICVQCTDYRFPDSEQFFHHHSSFSEKYRSSYCSIILSLLNLDSISLSMLCCIVLYFLSSPNSVIM